MNDGITITEGNAEHIEPIKRKVSDLIRRFNDPNHEHILRGTFQDSDGLAVISAKQQQVATTISCALAELVALKTAVDYLKTQGQP